MKKTVNLIAFTICLTAMLCASIFSQTAATQKPAIIEPPFEMHVVEKMKDGSFIVNIDGVEYRAFSSDRVKQFALDKSEVGFLRTERDKLTANSVRAESLAKRFQEELATADEETAKQEQRAEKFKTMYERENALRLAAEKLKKPSKLERILSNPVIQTVVTVAAAVATATIAKTQ